ITLNTSISGGSPTAAPLIDNNVITSAYYGIYQSAWMEGAGNPVLAPSITGNTITTGGDGIIVSMSSQSLSPGSVGTYTPTVTDNGINITNGGYGIQLYFEDVYSGSIVADLTVSNNVLTSNGVCCGAGMSLSMSYFPTSGSANVGWTIANNSVSGFYYEGLFFEISELSGDTNGLEGTVDVLITGNTVTNNGFNGMSLSISPYNFTGTQNLLVQGNTITDNGGKGLVFSVSSQTDVTTNSIKILDNVIDGNAGGGLDLWIEQWAPGGIPTNPTLVSGNTITNNAVGQPSSPLWAGVLVGAAPTADFGGGNLGSPGGNVISGNGSWDFVNETSAIVKAESNDWGSTSSAAIDARIYDDDENTLRGLVDFEPIANAVPPVTCPTAISPVAPTSGAQVEPSGFLSWSGGAGATAYKVYLGPAGSGCSTLVGTTTATSMAFNGLTPGEYDWKVVAEKAGCTTPPESACIRFTVANPCPNQAPSLIAPEANAQVPRETRFEWTTVPDATRYRLVIYILGGGGGFEELAVVPQPSGPLPPTVGFDATLPLGTVQWRVFADYPGGCESVSSRDQIVTVVRSCPSGAPVPITPLENAPVGETPVLFRWSPVSETVRYELYLAINGAPFQNVGTVPGTAETPSIAVDIPAGASIAWYAEAFFEQGCGSARSRTVNVEVSCFPPVLSLQGEVTTGKPYEVRATIVSVGQEYLFEESETQAFTTVLASKQGQVDPTGQFVFAMFEHEVTQPRAFFYRVKVAQAGCEFSDVGRIVVIPLPPPTSTDADTVVQFGNEEEVRQPLFIASPTPDRQTSYTYIATTDRDWMRVEPPGGTIGQAGVTVMVVTNPVGLPVGTNTGTVMLTFVELAGSGKQALETTPVTGSKPVSVTLVTPVTNKGKGGPAAESLIIPAVAHASGVNSEWQTDVRILNLSAQKQKYRLFWTSTGTDATLSGKNCDLELAPGQSSALDDIVKQWYGLGSMPGENATGVLEIRPVDSSGAGKGASAVPVTRSLSSLASSRTYNKTPQGTLGEYIPAIPFASFVGGGTPAGGEKSVLSLQQLAQSSSYRTNIGVAEASGQPVALEMRFFDGEGTKLLTVPVSLRAGEHQQFNQILATHGLTNVTNARAEIEVVSGNGKIAAYASVVDNVTGDPLQVRAVDLATISARKYVLPGIAHFDTGQA
ncbi:MAG TPA: right-handed parallel beta-helix repeat-containing protein, partial [Thermoanaerobaculia bacterium]|nr:right-handed parallel beta-helix repeat-containing protein [Thermoanaerobaculia bacterium]